MKQPKRIETGDAYSPADPGKREWSQAYLSESSSDEDNGDREAPNIVLSTTHLSASTPTISPVTRTTPAHPEPAHPKPVDIRQVPQTTHLDPSIAEGFSLSGKMSPWNMSPHPSHNPALPATTPIVVTPVDVVPVLKQAETESASIAVERVQVTLEEVADEDPEEERRRMLEAVERVRSRKVAEAVAERTRLQEVRERKLRELDARLAAMSSSETSSRSMVMSAEGIGSLRIMSRSKTDHQKLATNVSVDDASQILRPSVKSENRTTVNAPMGGEGPREMVETKKRVSPRGVSHTSSSCIHPDIKLKSGPTRSALAPRDDIGGESDSLCSLNVPLEKDNLPLNVWSTSNHGPENGRIHESAIPDSISLELNAKVPKVFQLEHSQRAKRESRKIPIVRVTWEDLRNFMTADISFGRSFISHKSAYSEGSNAVSPSRSVTERPCAISKPTVPHENRNIQQVRTGRRRRGGRGRRPSGGNPALLASVM